MIPLEQLWCQYLNASTQVVYPPAPGAIRVTLLGSDRLGRGFKRVTLLVELWADPATSETDALTLAELIELADSQYRLGGSIYAVAADHPLAHPDPDSDLDRYQITVTHHIKEG